MIGVKYRLLILLLVFAFVKKNSSTEIESGSFENLDKFYNYYANITGKTNVTISIFRTGSIYECCVQLNKTYCASHDLTITVCCKNIETIDIRCSDILRIEYTIYYNSTTNIQTGLRTDQVIALGVSIPVVTIVLIIIVILFRIKKSKLPASQELISSIKR